MKFNAPQFFAPSPPGALATTIGISGPTQTATIHGVSGETGLLIDETLTISVQSVTVSWKGIEVAGFLEIDGVTSLWQTAPAGYLSIPCYDLLLSITTGLEVINNSSGGNYIVSMFYKEQL